MATDDTSVNAGEPAGTGEPVEPDHDDGAQEPDVVGEPADAKQEPRGGRAGRTQKKNAPPEPALEPVQEPVREPVREPVQAAAPATQRSRLMERMSYRRAVRPR